MAKCSIPYSMCSSILLLLGNIFNELYGIFANMLNFVPLSGTLFSELYGMNLASFEQDLQIFESSGSNLAIATCKSHFECGFKVWKFSLNIFFVFVCLFHHLLLFSNLFAQNIVKFLPLFGKMLNETYGINLASCEQHMQDFECSDSNFGD